MKKSVIIDILNGKRGHFETMPLKKDGDACYQRAEEAYDKLMDKLNPELKSLYDNLKDADEDVQLTEINHYFKEGFKLGLQIGIECTEE